MAVTGIGTDATDQEHAASGSFSVTIDADADVLIVIVSGYNSSIEDPETLFDQLYWNSDTAALDFTEIASEFYSGNSDTMISSACRPDKTGYRLDRNENQRQ